MRLSAPLLACALAAAPLCSLAQVSINIQVPGIVAVAPPAPRYEPPPPPRVGYVWVPGAWQYRQDSYAWQRGYWQPARPDHVYAPGRWVRAEGGWRWAEPNWRPAPRGKGHRHDRDDRHDRHDHDDDHHHHCPPGQAKKGRC